MSGVCKDKLQSKLTRGNGGNAWNQVIGDLQYTNFVNLSDPEQAYASVGKVWDAGEWSNEFGGSDELMIDYIKRTAGDADFNGYWERGHGTIYLGTGFNSKIDYRDGMKSAQSTLIHEMLHRSFGTHLEVADFLGIDYLKLPGQSELILDSNAADGIKKWIDGCLK
jgi:hypothetical protein